MAEIQENLANSVGESGPNPNPVTEIVEADGQPYEILETGYADASQFKIAPPLNEEEKKKALEYVESMNALGVLQDVIVDQSWGTVCGRKRIFAAAKADVKIPYKMIKIDPASGGLITAVENNLRAVPNCRDMALDANKTAKWVEAQDRKAGIISTSKGGSSKLGIPKRAGDLLGWSKTKTTVFLRSYSRLGPNDLDVLDKIVGTHLNESPSNFNALSLPIFSGTDVHKYVDLSVDAAAIEDDDERTAAQSAIAPYKDSQRKTKETQRKADKQLDRANPPTPPERNSTEVGPPKEVSEDGSGDSHSRYFSDPVFVAITKAYDNAQPEIRGAVRHYVLSNE